MRIGTQHTMEQHGQHCGLQPSLLP
ncbi:protein of unknown function [Streptomyces sp. KY75]|nr:protein of unknown function [Streptomyces sp. KY75]CAD5975292.1 protein of unknown function [Streptomyces sp. KY70]